MTSFANKPDYWDKLAATFDDEPDHGLDDPVVRHEWRRCLQEWLPDRPLSILDAGCGTGSLSLLMAELGHQVTGIDWSPAMIALATSKAAASGRALFFEVGDARDPQRGGVKYDVVTCRHLLWAFTEPREVLQRWIELLVPGGMLLLIEGHWHTGGGLHANGLREQLPRRLAEVYTYDLSKRPDLWGGEVTDERFAMVARLSKAGADSR